MTLQQQVYEKLWKLFKDECPYFVEFQRINKGIDIYEIIKRNRNYSISEQINKIIFEILPVSVGLCDIGACCEILHILKTLVPDGKNNYKVKLNWYLFYEGNDERELVGSEDWQDDIWQAILSLLTAIESHPDRDKFKFVWGENC